MSKDFDENHSGNLPFFTFIVLKLAARCNLNCDYCYWFKDDDVYQHPKKLTPSAQESFIERLKEYLKQYPYKEFNIVFHGGEPLLFGKDNFNRLCKAIIVATKEYCVDIVFSIATNAVLIDQQWAELFKKYNINISISLDGDEKTNDRLRPDFDGKGSHHAVVRAIDVLRENDLQFGVLAVCDPKSDPKELLHHFCHDLKIMEFEVLFPEITHHMTYQPIWQYYVELFDQWYQYYAQKNVRIRNLDAIIRVLMGKSSVTDHFGYSANNSVCVFTDGSFGGPDELNLLGSNPNYLNVFDHDFVEIFSAPDWVEAYNASLNLPEQCNQCRYKMECGGGSLQTRFREDTRFNNVSVYCQDRQILLDHIANRLVSDLI